MLDLYTELKPREFLYYVSLNLEKITVLPIKDFYGIKLSFQTTACKVRFFIGSATKIFVFFNNLSSFRTSTESSILIIMQMTSNYCPRILLSTHSPRVIAES